MTYQDISFCNSLLSSIPLTIEGQPMPAKTSTDVILLQVAYQNKLKEFEDFMQEVLKKLKKDGFDERFQKNTRIEDINKRLKAHDEWTTGQTDADGKPVERPAKPSDEELKEVEDARTETEDFKAELDELNTAYQAAYGEKFNEEVKGMKKFSRETYENIVAFIGFTGEITINLVNREPATVSKQDFLRMVGFNLVNIGE